MEKNLSSLWFIQVSALRVNPYSAMVIYLHFNPLSAGDAFKRIHTVFPQLKFDRN